MVILLSIIAGCLIAIIVLLSLIAARVDNVRFQSAVRAELREISNTLERKLSCIPNI